MAAYLLLFLVICFSVVCVRVDSAAICFVTKESAMQIGLISYIIFLVRIIGPQAIRMGTVLHERNQANTQQRAQDFKKYGFLVFGASISI